MLLITLLLLLCQSLLDKKSDDHFIIQHDHSKIQHGRFEILQNALTFSKEDSDSVRDSAGLAVVLAAGLQTLLTLADDPLPQNS
jgi:hypothetical protein